MIGWADTNGAAAGQGEAMTRADHAQRDEWLAWCRDRTESVTSPTGNLALVAYEPVGPEPVLVGQIPAAAARAGNRDGIWLTASVQDKVTVDAEQVDGTAFVARLRPDGTPIIRWGRYSADVFSLDGTGYELRIYDAEASALRRFERIETYDYDPGLAVEGVFAPFGADGQVPWGFTRLSDSGHRKTVPGTITVPVGGASQQLLAFLDGDHLVIVFADGTTGTESYAPGRFLRLPRPAAAGPVTVDFNRAFVPPCGFSDFYSCPVPPPQNRLNTPVRGGERGVRWKAARLT
jgi:uncharacterized protein (DUF1684 family)